MRPKNNVTINFWKTYREIWSKDKSPVEYMPSELIEFEKKATAEEVVYGSYIPFYSVVPGGSSSPNGKVWSPVNLKPKTVLEKFKEILHGL